MPDSIKNGTRRVMCMARIVPYNPIAFPPFLEVRCTNAANAGMRRSGQGETLNYFGHRAHRGHREKNVIFYTLCALIP